MENTVVKKIVITIVSILILVVLAIFISKMLAKNNKEYETVEIAEKDYRYFQIYSNEKFGVADSTGKMVIENNYSDIIIPNPTKEVFFCTSEDANTSILNANNEKIFTQFQNVSVIELEGSISNLPYDKSVLRYEENGKFGLIDYEGNIITKAIYEEIASVKYKDGEILAKKDGKYGVINNKGVELIPFEYDEIEGDKYFENSYRDTGYIVKNTTNEGYRYGYINNEWKKMIDTNYTSLSRILDIHGNDIYLIAAKDGQYGVIKNKEEVVGFEYQSIIYNNDTKLLSVQRNQNYGVIDLKGEIIVPTQYRSIRFNGMYIYAKSASSDKYFDTDGKEVEQKYTGMKKIEGKDLYIVTDNNNLYGLVDKDGKQLVENKYLYMDNAFDEYFIAYKEGEGLGVIDKNDNVLINFEYNGLNKIDDKELIKAVNMNTEEETTTIFSKDMQKITSMTNAGMGVYEEYIELYNDEGEVYISNDGKIKQANEIIEPVFLSKYFKTYKDNGEIYYSDERM